MGFDPEIWGTVADWTVAATAMFGVGAGLSQLSSIYRANYQTAQFERAKLLLDIDRDFEGDVLLAARQRTLVVRNRIEKEIEQLAPPLSAERQKAEIARRFSDYVTATWVRSRTFDGDPAAPRDDAAAEYMTLMRLPYWCETLGHQCRRNLVPLEDILDLYDQLIIFVIGDLVEHIRLRAENGAHRNPRYLENALWLYGEAARYKAEKESRPAGTVNRSRLDWRR